ncbi:hypothetical protein Pla22_28090 [Rubripirellula amarantea]|uniref:Uncharacterized protein n=1 Tax=Rubripirellula amarantea TaxID=2527999 RepID=A0A5C5WZ08_9BACT|nr:hypothetical protein [Rubripirellula amarantea]TWT55155.1 hypothetical protein Pla22_28090 [Rubripirellula amarantea]
MKKLTLILSAVLFVFGALLASAFVMNNFAPSPVTAAKDHSVDQGWAENELSLLSFETSSKIAGSQGTVRLKGSKPNRQETIRVELRKSLFGPKWQVVEYSASLVEEDSPEDARP